MTIENVTTQRHGENASPFEFSFDATDGDILVLALLDPSNGSSALPITYNGDSLTQQVERIVTGASNQTSSIWTLTSPSTGSNTFSITWGGGTKDLIATLYAISGIDTTTPVLGTDTVYGVRTGSPGATLYSGGATYTVSQTEKRDGMGIFTALIPSSSPGATFKNVSSGTPVLSGGTDRTNSSNLGGGIPGSAWCGDTTYSDGADVSGTAYCDAQQAENYSAGGCLLALQGPIKSPPQIIEFE